MRWVWVIAVSVLVGGCALVNENVSCRLEVDNLQERNRALIAALQKVEAGGGAQGEVARSAIEAARHK